MYKQRIRCIYIINGKTKEVISIEIDGYRNFNNKSYRHPFVLIHIYEYDEESSFYVENESIGRSNKKPKYVVPIKYFDEIKNTIGI